MLIENRFDSNEAHSDCVTQSIIFMALEIGVYSLIFLFVYIYFYWNSTAQIAHGEVQQS